MQARLLPGSPRGAHSIAETGKMRHFLAARFMLDHVGDRQNDPRVSIEAVVLNRERE
jgi:hypothetical protein